MLKFPLSKVDEAAHNAAIMRLLNDDECIIFFDTNILAQFYKLHSEARAEFYGWLNSFLEKERIKVPAWCLHEYTNRFKSDLLKDYMPHIKYMSQISNDFREVERYLTMIVDDGILTNTTFAGREDFFAQLSSAHNIVKNLNKLAKESQKNIDAIHDELADKLSSCVLKSDIYNLAIKCSDDSYKRFLNKIPPGFKDSGKFFNNAGDLIFWHEIMDYGAKPDVVPVINPSGLPLRKIVLFTNDQKADWVYAPRQKITAYTSGNSIPNTDPRIKLIDPRLIHEYSLRTNVPDPEIYIINFDYLFELLSREDKTSFNQIAIAIQVIKKVENIDKKAKKEIKETDKKVAVVESAVDAKAESLNDSKGDSVPVDIMLGSTDSDVLLHTIKDSNDVKVLEYSTAAKKDSLYIFHESSVVADVVSMLKYYNWDTQNAGINNVYSVNLFLASSEDLFVLGRNIYQAADGNSFEAMRFIKNFEANMRNYDNDVKSNILAGMLYEVYFNSKGEFRFQDGKTRFFSELVDLVQSKYEYSDVIKFVKRELNSMGDYSLFDLENNESNIQVDIYLNFLHDGAYVAWGIADIKKDSLKVYHLTQPSIYSVPVYQGLDRVSELEDLITQTFYIPTGRVDWHVHYDKQVEGRTYLEVRQNAWLGI